MSIAAGLVRRAAGPERVHRGLRLRRRHLHGRPLSARGLRRRRPERRRGRCRLRRSLQGVRSRPTLRRRQGLCDRRLRQRTLGLPGRRRGHRRGIAAGWRGERAGWQRVAVLRRQRASDLSAPGVRRRREERRRDRRGLRGEGLRRLPCRSGLHGQLGLPVADLQGLQVPGPRSATTCSRTARRPTSTAGAPVLACKETRELRDGRRLHHAVLQRAACARAPRAPTSS